MGRPVAAGLMSLRMKAEHLARHASGRLLLGGGESSIQSHLVQARGPDGRALLPGMPLSTSCTKMKMPDLPTKCLTHTYVSLHLFRTLAASHPRTFDLTLFQTHAAVE